MKMSQENKLAIKEDLLTVPNALTLGRLVALPFLYRAVKRDPAANWVSAGVVAFSDKADGLAAKQEDKSQNWAKWGFRRSKTGRIGDPIVDTLFSGAIIHAGEKSGAIPRLLSKSAKAQKLAKTVISAIGTVKGEEINVNYTGKLGEFKTVLGMGLLLGSTGIEKPTRRFAARAASCGIAAAGIGMSAVASIDYARQSGLLPAQPSPIEQSLEAYAEVVVRMPEQAIGAFRSENAA